MAVNMILLGGLAEFERSLIIIARTGEGRKRAGPPALTPH